MLDAAHAHGCEAVSGAASHFAIGELAQKGVLFRKPRAAFRVETRDGQFAAGILDREYWMPGAPGDCFVSHFAQQSFFFFGPRFPDGIAGWASKFVAVDAHRGQAAPDFPGDFLVRQGAEQPFFLRSPGPVIRWAGNVESQAPGRNGCTVAAQLPCNFIIGSGAEQGVLLRSEGAHSWRGVANAKRATMNPYGSDGAFEAAGDYVIRRDAEQLLLGAGPVFEAGPGSQRRDAQRGALSPDIFDRTTQAAGGFVVIDFAKQFDFVRGPAAGRRG